MPILLLDAAWRIDRVIGVETACELLVCSRAVGVSEDIATVMHSPSITVEVPSVIARIGRVGRNRYRPPSCNARRVRLATTTSASSSSTAWPVSGAATPSTTCCLAAAVASRAG